uniref:Integrase catalytic domain-containing protein n=1 Tax=Molossus molossus TaxID=27622 RepID=A0A7J8HZS9_MOLMO|nr:hypothetical protein HJG59_010770 [Molossus molossus]
MVPRFGLPLALGSDNGPAFIVQTTKLSAKALGITWKLHGAYRPQSSGQVERMKRTLKKTLTKLHLEAGDNWVSLLLFALLCVPCTPYLKGFTSFEIMFGQPPPILCKIEVLDEVLAKVGNHNLLSSLQAIQRLREQTRQPIKDTRPQPGTPQIPPHDFNPGDWVWVKKHQPASLEPRWTGPFLSS